MNNTAKFALDLQLQEGQMLGNSQHKHQHKQMVNAPANFLMNKQYGSNMPHMNVGNMIDMFQNRQAYEHNIMNNHFSTQKINQNLTQYGGGFRGNNAFMGHHENGKKYGDKTMNELYFSKEENIANHIGYFEKFDNLQKQQQRGNSNQMKDSKRAHHQPYQGNSNPFHDYNSIRRLQEQAQQIRSVNLQQNGLIMYQGSQFNHLERFINSCQEQSRAASQQPTLSPSQEQQLHQKIMSDRVQQQHETQTQLSKTMSPGNRSLIYQQVPILKTETSQIVAQNIGGGERPLEDTDLPERSSFNDNDSRASSVEIQDEEDLEYGSEVGSEDGDHELLFINRCHNHGYQKLDMSHLIGKHQSKSAPKLTISQEEEYDQYFENENTKKLKRNNSDFKLLKKKNKKLDKKNRNKTKTEFRIQSAVTTNKYSNIKVIKGHFRGNPYKLTKQSKFINNTEKINQKLNQTIVNQIKKDFHQHGTYTLNPYAFYPKNLKNTINVLIGEKFQGEFRRGYESAFIDTKKLRDDPLTLTKLKDMKYVNDDELLVKKRYLNSTTIDQSFHIKQVFNIWIKLHSEYQFEGIQKKLLKQKSSHMLPPRNNTSQIKTYTEPDYYKGKKLEQKQFTKWKDNKLQDLNDKYLHPTREMQNFCFSQKRPLIFAADIVNATNEHSPIKKYARGKHFKKDGKQDEVTETQDTKPEQNENDEDQSTDETKTLTFKEQIMKLDEKKKRAFMQYNRWRNSLYNEKNVAFETSHPLTQMHDQDYVMFCTKIGSSLLNEQNGNRNTVRQRNNSGRVQSAKSGIYRSGRKPTQNFSNYSNSKYEQAYKGNENEIDTSTIQSQLQLSKNKSVAQHSSYAQAQDMQQQQENLVNSIEEIQQMAMRTHIQRVRGHNAIANYPVNVPQQQSVSRVPSGKSNMKGGNSSFSNYVRNIQKLSQNQDIIENIHQQSNQILGASNNGQGSQTSVAPYEVVSHSKLEKFVPQKEYSDIQKIQNDRLDTFIGERDQKRSSGVSKAGLRLHNGAVQQSSSRKSLNDGGNYRKEGHQKLNQTELGGSLPKNAGDSRYEPQIIKQGPSKNSKSALDKLKQIINRGDISSSTHYQQSNVDEFEPDPCASKQLSQKLQDKIQNQNCKVKSTSIQKYEYRNGVLTKETIQSRINDIEQSLGTINRQKQQHFNIDMSVKQRGEREQLGELYTDDGEPRSVGLKAYGSPIKVSETEEGYQQKRDFILSDDGYSKARRHNLSSQRQKLLQNQQRDAKHSMPDGAEQSIRYPKDALHSQSLGSRQQQARLQQIQQQDKHQSSDEQSAPFGGRYNRNLKSSQCKPQNNEEAWGIPKSASNAAPIGIKGLLLREQHEKELLEKAKLQQNSKQVSERQRNTEPHLATFGLRQREGCVSQHKGVPPLISKFHGQNHHTSDSNTNSIQADAGVEAEDSIKQQLLKRITSATGTEHTGVSRAEMVNGQSTRNTNRSQASFASIKKLNNGQKHNSGGARPKPVPAHTRATDPRVISARSSKFSQGSAQQQRIAASGGGATHFSRQQSEQSAGHNFKVQPGLQQRYDAHERQGSKKHHVLEESPEQQDAVNQQAAVVTHLKQQEISDRIYQNLQRSKLQQHQYPKSQLSQSKDPKKVNGHHGGSLRASLQQYHLAGKTDTPYNPLMQQRPAAAGGIGGTSTGNSQRQFKSGANANSQAEFRRTGKNKINSSTKQIFRAADFQKI